MTKNKYPYQDLSLKDLKGELWDDMPGLDGAYEISNFGRVKSKRRFIERHGNGGMWIKERILKLRKTRQVVSDGKRTLYRLAVSISFEGNHYSFQIARTVYYLFVKRFNLEDTKIKVRTKDEDPFNIYPDNLFLTSTDVYMKNAYESKRRRRDSFGNKGKPVSQYDLNGKWVKTHLTLSLAAKSIKGSSGHIFRALDEGHGYANGFIWKRGEAKDRVLPVPERVKRKIASEIFHSTPVSQYDLNGNKKREFETLNAAAKTVKTQPNSIRKAMLGRSITASGHIWKLGSGPAKISLSAFKKRIKQGKATLSRPVTQYSLTGKKIKSFESVSAAARAVGTTGMNITGVLKSEGQRTAEGYLWFYGMGKSKIKVHPKIKQKIKLDRMHAQPVTQYSLEGKRIAIHASIKEASKNMKDSPAYIISAATGRSLSYGGFYWRLGKGKVFIKNTSRADAENRRLKKLSKPVIQFDLKGKKIKEYRSIGEASRATQTSAGKIRMMTLSESRATKGFIWKLK